MSSRSQQGTRWPDCIQVRMRPACAQPHCETQKNNQSSSKAHAKVLLYLMVSQYFGVTSKPFRALQHMPHIWHGSQMIGSRYQEAQQAVLALMNQGAISSVNRHSQNVWKAAVQTWLWLIK